LIALGPTARCVCQLHGLNPNRNFWQSDHGRIDPVCLPDGFNPSYVIPGAAHGALSLSLAHKYAGPPRPAKSPQKANRKQRAQSAKERGWDYRFSLSVSSVNSGLHPHYRNWFDRPADMGDGKLQPCVPPRCAVSTHCDTGQPSGHALVGHPEPRLHINALCV
jgi:hypothetical protein